MLDTIKKYQKLKESITALLDVSGYRNDYVAKKMGMTPAYFSVKKQRGKWTEKELENILKILTTHNEDVENYLMLEEMRSRKDDGTISYEEYKQIIATWK